MCRKLGYGDYRYSGIINTLMGQNTDVDKSDAQMWAMKLEGYGMQERATLRLQELMPGVALPKTLREMAFLIPQGHLTVSLAQPARALVTANQLISLVKQVQQDSLVSMQQEKPSSHKCKVHIGMVSLGSKGMLSMLVLLDEKQQPWTFFIHTQQPDDSTATTAKDVVCSLETDLRGFSTLPQLSPPAWRNWHRGPNDVPTAPVRAKRPAAAKSSTKLPFDQVVYVYVSNSMLSPAEQSTLRWAVAAGHPWLQQTVIHSSSIRTGYFRRNGGWSNNALRHAILEELR